MALVLLLAVMLAGPAVLTTAAPNVTIYRALRDCVAQQHSYICLKEKAVEIMDQVVASNEPLHLTEYLDVVKDPNYHQNAPPNESEELLSDLPAEADQRSLKLNDMLVDKIDSFFRSRSIKLNLAGIMEGRKKNNKNGMMMMGGLAMAGMMAQLYMGKIAMMAGAALMMAKMALMLSIIIGLKKLVGGGGGGGGTEHIVYASSGGDYGHSHGGGGGGGGGYHRSLSLSDDNINIPSAMAYRAQNTDTTNNIAYN